jgi:hypothetical protein
MASRHAANTYLIEQFLRDSVNDRSGPYGGSIANRARLLLEVMRRDREIGAGRTGIRLSPMTTFTAPLDSDPQALYGYVVEQLAPFGLAYLHVIEAKPAARGRRKARLSITKPCIALSWCVDGQQRLLARIGRRQVSRRARQTWSPSAAIHQHAGPRPPPEGQPAAQRTARRQALWRWGRGLHRPGAGCLIALDRAPTGQPGQGRFPEISCLNTAAGCRIGLIVLSLTWGYTWVLAKQGLAVRALRLCRRALRGRRPGADHRGQADGRSRKLVAPRQTWPSV